MGQETSRIKRPPSVIPAVPQQVPEETHSFTITDGPTTYKITKFIASGAFGSVHAAIDLSAPNNDRWRAIKIMQPDSENKLQYVEKEMEILKSLQHPTIVRYRHHFIKTKNTGERTFYLVMELCEGDSLEKYLKENTTLPIDVVMLWFIKLVEALAYFHARGLIHRDIKPDNILTTLNDEVKLADFGVAKNTSDGTRAPTTRVGTNGYMAPEVDENSNLSYNTKADIWSLGCVLYRCLVGTLDSVDFDNKCSAVQAESVRMLLQKMLCRDVRTRASAEQLLYDPILLGWRLMLGLDIPSDFRSHIPQCDCLLPLLDLIQFGSLESRFVGLNFFTSAKLTANSDIRKLLTVNALETYAQDLLSKDGDTFVGQQSQAVLTPFNDFTGPELRAANCIGRIIQLADRHKKLCIPALNILNKLAKEDVATRAIIAYNPQAQDLVKDFITGNPQYAPLISQENFTNFTSFLQPSQIAPIVAEFFKSKSRLLTATSRKELLLTAINYGHFDVVFEHLFDWPLIANTASASGKCLAEYARNLPLPFESYTCTTCKIDKQDDVLCAACRMLHHTHDLVPAPKTKVFCAGRNPTSTSPSFPISKNFDRHTDATFSSATPSIVCRAGNIEARLQPTETCVCTSSIAYVDKKYCFYFETEIKVAGSTNAGISIGFAPHHIKTFPGREDGSIGYCSNGKLIICNEEIPYGPSYSAGDIIGCGILLNGQVFFTKNGVFINYYQFNSSKRNVVLFHAIGLHSGRFNLQINYGATPFAYNYSPDVKLQQNNLPLRLEVCKEILQVTSLETFVQQLSHVKDRNSILYYLMCLHSVAIQDPGNRQKIASLLQRQVLWRALETKQADTQWASLLVNEIFNGPSRASTQLTPSSIPVATPTPTPQPAPPKVKGPGPAPIPVNNPNPNPNPQSEGVRPISAGPKKFMPSPNPNPQRGTEVPVKPKPSTPTLTEIPPYRGQQTPPIGGGTQTQTQTSTSTNTSPGPTVIPGEITLLLEHHGTSMKYEIYLMAPATFQAVMGAVCEELNVAKEAISVIRKKSNDTVVQSDQHARRLQHNETLIVFLK